MYLYNLLYIHLQEKLYKVWCFKLVNVRAVGGGEGQYGTTTL